MGSAMSIVWVSSFFKYGERFVPAKEATGIVPDSFYVEGALCITVDGQEFLTLAHADLVDQLWLYVVDGLRKLRAGDVFETYFPDQPTRLTFRPLGPERFLLTVKTDAGKKSVQARRTEVLVHSAKERISFSTLWISLFLIMGLIYRPFIRLSMGANLPIQTGVSVFSILPMDNSALVIRLCHIRPSFFEQCMMVIPLICSLH